MRHSLGAHLAATHIPRRLILLDAELFSKKGEFERILIHEIFHFVWVRLSNQTRWHWEELLAKELAAHARGELGWSSEWRKNKLTRVDVRRRSTAWRRYICESFCDTSSWLCAGLQRHEEHTLCLRSRRTRRDWFLVYLFKRVPVFV